MQRERRALIAAESSAAAVAEAQNGDEHVEPVVGQVEQGHPQGQQVDDHIKNENYQAQQGVLQDHQGFLQDQHGTSQPPPSASNGQDEIAPVQSMESSSSRARGSPALTGHGVISGRVQKAPHKGNKWSAIAGDFHRPVAEQRAFRYR